MRARFWMSGLLVAMLAATSIGGPRAAVAAEGAAMPSGVLVSGAAGDRELSPAQGRTQQRRRHRQQNRRWINVAQMGVDEALALVDDPGVVIIDVTCRKRGATIADRIPGALWRDCTTVEEWAHQLEGARTILVYCA